jgi:hypothetical protein
MQEIIRSTTNYGLFELHQFNRNIGTTQLLEESMKKHGWISAYPMLVTKNGNGLLKIKSGHHRFTAATRIGIPVKYVIVDNNSITIHELERTTKQWSLHDYLNSYYRVGLNHYGVVKQYIEDTGISIAPAISLCAGESAASNNHRDRFKAGAYKTGDMKRANDIKSMVVALKRIGFKYAASTPFVWALSRVSWVKEFDPLTFLKKAGSHSQLLEKQKDQQSYLEMIESIYNFSAKLKRVPLAFLANEAARERNAAQVKSAE